MIGGDSMIKTGCTYCKFLQGATDEEGTVYVICCANELFGKNDPLPLKMLVKNGCPMFIEIENGKTAAQIFASISFAIDNMPVDEYDFGYHK